MLTRQLRLSDFGLIEEDPAGLRGGDAAENAAAFRAVLAGQAGAPRAAAVMEAALALHAVGVAEDLPVCARRAEAVLDGGAARALLDRWVVASRLEA